MREERGKKVHRTEIYSSDILIYGLQLFAQRDLQNLRYAYFEYFAAQICNPFRNLLARTKREF